MKVRRSVDHVRGVMRLVLEVPLTGDPWSEADKAWEACSKELQAVQIRDGLVAAPTPEALQT